MSSTLANPALAVVAALREAEPLAPVPRAAHAITVGVDGPALALIDAGSCLPETLAASPA